MGGNHHAPILMPFETANEMKRHEKLIKEKKFWEDMIKEVEEVRV